MGRRKDTILCFQSSVCDDAAAAQRGVLRYAEARRWKVRVVPYAAAARMHRTECADGGRPDVARLVSFLKPAGAVVCAGAAPDLLRDADFGGLPVVFLDGPRGPAWRRAVRSDQAAVAAVAARELLRLGFRDFAYVPWFAPQQWCDERCAAFRAICEREGRAFHRFDPPCGGSEEAWLVAMSDWLAALPKPCGVFAANDLVGERVLTCAALRRIAVPRELAVVGVDDDSLTCERAAPTITSVPQDFERGGYEAARLLDMAISGADGGAAEALFAPLPAHRRASTRLYPRRDARVSAALDLIRRTACGRLSVGDVVAAMGCSRRLAELRFREVTGRSVLSEIRAVRMDRAAELLERTAKPLSEIARLCGYGSTAVLRRVFRARFGESPTARRRKAGI